MANFPKLAVAACAITVALASPVSAQYLQAPQAHAPSGGAMVDNSLGADGQRPAADSTPLVDNSVDNSVRTIPPGLKAPHADLPTPQAGAVRYISGGISEEGREGFLAAHAGEGYNTKLLFIGPSGNMLADVVVTIRNTKADILQATTDGPLLLAELPPGSYSVTANYKGESQSQKLTVKNGKTMSAATFRFKNGD